MQAAIEARAAAARAGAERSPRLLGCLLQRLLELLARLLLPTQLPTQLLRARARDLGLCAASGGTQAVWVEREHVPGPWP